MSKHHYVLLDRDGVINQDSDAYIKSPEEWQPIPGSLEAIALFNQSGYKVIVITNQSGVGRGLFTLDSLYLIHEKMLQAVKSKGGQIEAIYYCPHLPEENCHCRKPEPGLLMDFSKDYNVNLRDIPFVGDTLKDIQAGVSVGACPLLVKTGKGNNTVLAYPNLKIPVFEDLHAAATFIISR